MRKVANSMALAGSNGCSGGRGLLTLPLVASRKRCLGFCVRVAEAYWLGVSAVLAGLAKASSGGLLDGCVGPYTIDVLGEACLR